MGVKILYWNWVWFWKNKEEMKIIVRVLNIKMYFLLEVFIKLKFKVIWEFKKCNEKWFLVLYKVWVVIWIVIRLFFIFFLK